MDFKKIAAALILLPIFIWLIGWGPSWLILGIVLVLVVGMGGAEYCNIILGKGSFFETALLWLFSGIVCILTATLFDPVVVMVALSGSLILICIAIMLKEKDLSKVGIKSGAIFFGVVLIGYFSGMIVALKGLEDGGAFGSMKLLMLLFGIVWINDAGAYFAGTSLGKHKLSPNLSPNKTIEGSVGGFVATILFAVVFALIYDSFPMKDALILGVVCGVAGPLGDLFESAIKRGADVKDSGNFMPGHGGVLDRVDSVLFCVPVIYFYVLFKIGGFGLEQLAK